MSAPRVNPRIVTRICTACTAVARFIETIPNEQLINLFWCANCNTLLVDAAHDSQTIPLKDMT